MRWSDAARTDHHRHVIAVQRLRPSDSVFDTVFQWHWSEWGVVTRDADAAGWRAQLANRCQAEGIPFTLVASLDGEPVGCVSVCEDDLDTRFADRGPWLSGMVVIGPARNLGVGRALLQAAADHARDESATELWVWTTEAGPFYKRCGYTYQRRKTGLHDRSVLNRSL
jgi:GNAT superfamily N-acetyltransferase